MDLFDIRKDYHKGHLDKDDLLSDPILQIEQWIADAEAAKCLEHSAITLSTVNQEGGASSRIVLLKKIDAEGLYIFTNYNSRKGQQLEMNNKAAILFFWPELERQINIEGQVEKCSAELSDDYYNQRPLESRVSAKASQQSQEIDSRETMETAWKNTLVQAQKEGIERPEYWGGYLLKPTRVEFWQGGANRFHDRILFELYNNSWSKKRLMP